ncbi:MAG: nodulation protein NfeD [Halofilum sp. (in: g-proteobacteria)]
MRRIGAILVLLGGLLLAAGAAVPADTGSARSEGNGQAMLLEVQGAIGPATTDYLTRSLEDAAAGGHRIVVVRLNTPGGLVVATRDIVQAIRSSPVPVAVWVAPEGAQAASAGTYILYASHLAAMAPATNVGAATPISMGGGSPAPGGDPPENEGGGQDQSGAESGGEGTGDGEGGNSPTGQDDGAGAPSAGEQKAINDAAAWLRSLAQETGRNADWAERAVREAASLTAREAVEQNVAELTASSVRDLLNQADGRTVRVAGESVTLATRDLGVDHRAPDWRSELLAVITNPTVAYLLLMVGIYGLLLEGYSPGSLVPGTIGGISLLLGLYALQLLPVNYAGLLLIVLGILLMISEAFAPSFGILGIGGAVAMVVGSIILMDTDVPGFSIDTGAIAAMAVFSTAVMGGLVWLAVRSLRLPVVSGSQEIAHARGEVLEPVDPERGTVFLLGERWQARSHHPIPAGRTVRVVERNGLVLKVEADPHPEE